MPHKGQHCPRGAAATAVEWHRGTEWTGMEAREVCTSTTCLRESRDSVSDSVQRTDAEEAHTLTHAVARYRLGIWHEVTMCHDERLQCECTERKMAARA